MSDNVAGERVSQWIDKLPPIMNKFKDSSGRVPQYTFFYPEEEYKREYLDELAGLCRQGYGDVEIHLHHDNDTSEGLRKKLTDFKTILFEEHGLLRKDKTGEIQYGFIHGNWALDNSRKDGRMCGVNNELIVLRETGCYADFTLPSAPCGTQTTKINSIYYAVDDPDKPKSHDSGADVEAGKAGSGDLMIIQGPLALNWWTRKWGVFPKIENGDLSLGNTSSPERVRLWVNQHIHVKGRPEWVFIKVHTHGTQENNSKALLEGGLADMFSFLEDGYNDGNNYCLHYVSAWEMYNIIKAAEAGETENPAEFRNYLLDNGLVL